MKVCVAIKVEDNLFLYVGHFCIYKGASSFNMLNLVVGPTGDEDGRCKFDLRSIM